MADDVSKLCADHLRQTYPELKASHAREVVAAFFGYKSHAALLSDKANPADDIDCAAILIPDDGMIQERRACLKDLPKNLPPSFKLACEIAEFLQVQDLFDGDIWETWDVGEYVMEEYLPEHVNGNLDALLEDVTADVNAVFEEVDYYKVDVEEHRHGVSITVLGTYSGYSLEDDEDFDGDTIDIKVDVYLRRCAGRIGFEEPNVEVTGEINRDYLKDREPNVAGSNQRSLPANLDRSIHIQSRFLAFRSPDNTAAIA